MIQQFNLGIYPKPMKLSLERYFAALFTIAKAFKKGKQPEFIRGRIDKECDIIYMCVYNVYITYIYI